MALHQLQLAVTAPQASLMSQVEGSWKRNRRWQYLTRQLDLAYTLPKSPQSKPDTGIAMSHHWSLSAPAQGWFEPSAAEFMLAESCLLQHADSGSGQLCVAASNPSNRVAVEVALRKIDLAWLNPFLPARLWLGGELNGTGQWLGFTGATQADLQLAMLTVEVQQDRRWQQALQFDDGHIVLRPTTSGERAFTLAAALPMGDRVCGWTAA